MSKKIVFILLVIITVNFALGQQIQEKEVFMYQSDTLVFRIIRSLEESYNIERDGILKEKGIYFGNMNGIELTIGYGEKTLLTFMATLPEDLNYREINAYNQEYLFKFVKQKNGNIIAYIQIHFADGITLEHMISKITHFLDSIKEVSQDF